MKKSFYFALALTVGLFASCSSDDLSADAPRGGVDVNENEPAQITISTGNISYTRGTGTVGYPTSKWAGQKFNIFMFEKWINSSSEAYVYNNFKAATYKENDDSPELPIYLNTEMTTNPETQMAYYVLDDEVRYNYFPSSGAYSFWAYRIDDALDAEALSATATTNKTNYMYVNDEGNEVDSTLATKVIVPIDIDGSQDLMIAVADTVKALTDLQAKAEDATQNRIYTAYAARRAVNPRLKFSHLLTRLYFQVIADDRAVSREADWLINNNEGQSRAAGQTFRGFKITDIKVYTKSKGHVVAAYNNLSRVGEERLVFDEGQNWGAGSLNGGVATLKPVHLMTRDSRIDPARYDFVKKWAGYRGEANAPEGYVFLENGEATINVTADTKCYDTNGKDETPNTGTGMPTGTESTLGGSGDADVYIPVYYASETRANGTTYDAPSDLTDASAPLRVLDPDGKDAEALVPEWEGYEPGGNGVAAWNELTATCTYTWESTNDADIIAAHAGDPAVNVVPGTTTEGNVNDVKKYVDPETGRPTYYILRAIVWNVADAVKYDGAVSEAGIPTAAGELDDIVFTGYDGDGFPADPKADGIRFFKYYAQGADGEAGEAKATQMGEALLVAPADDNGYWVEFTYTRFKKITDTHVEPLTSHIGIQVTAGDGFIAGKSYRITARLYKDGDIVIGGDPDEEGSAIQPDEWDEDEDPEGTGGTDQKEWDLEDPNS